MLDNVGGGDVRRKNVRRSSAERAAIFAESYEANRFCAEFGGTLW